MHQGQFLFLLLALLFGLAAGLVGCFALMKRMLLAGDVISHLALPGLGLAFLYKIDPLIGGAATLFAGTLLVWRLQKKTGLTTDATIGVVFAAALALGAIVTPREDLIDALFGELQQVSLRGFFLGLVATLAIAASLFLLKDRLALTIFSPDLAASTGVNVNRVNLLFLLVFSLTVLVGLRFMGTLLASALIILPAAAARQLTDKLSGFLLVSAAIGVLSVLAGFVFNTLVLKLSTVGPTIVLFSALFFALSLLAEKN
ncbi:MAG TPA: metal ABC transporter permease [Candidatus Aquilonibacter sp.]|nr:metal ABC transporter permease [Candidatus Aquilonibacter sp.]